MLRNLSVLFHNSRIIMPFLPKPRCADRSPIWHFRYIGKQPRCLHHPPIQHVPESGNIRNHFADFFIIPCMSATKVGSDGSWELQRWHVSAANRIPWLYNGVKLQWLLSWRRRQKIRVQRNG